MKEVKIYSAAKIEKIQHCEDTSVGMEWAIGRKEGSTPSCSPN